MRRVSAILFLLAGLAGALRAAEPEVRVFYGLATNTTAEASANVLLVLAIDGEKVVGQMQTEAPLAGSGRLEGRLIGGWCELKGQLEEGFTIEFRGACNARDFRGTYTAAVPGELLQYGKFQLSLQSPAKVMPPEK